MAELVELGTISSRGQVAIPLDIRKEMGLEDGSRVLFLLEKNTLLVEKVTSMTWDEITKPLRAMKKGIAEADVDDFIHKARKK